MIQQTITAQYHAPSSGYKIKIQDILETDENKELLVLCMLKPPKGAAASSFYWVTDHVSLSVDCAYEKINQKQCYDIASYEKELAKYSDAKSLYHLPFTDSARAKSLFETCFFSEQRKRKDKYQKLSEVLTVQGAVANKKSFPELYFRFKELLNNDTDKIAENSVSKLKKLNLFQEILQTLIDMQTAYYSHDHENINQLFTDAKPAKAMDKLLELIELCRYPKDKLKTRNVHNLLYDILHILRVNLHYLREKNNAVLNKSEEDKGIYDHNHYKPTN